MTEPIVAAQPPAPPAKRRRFATFLVFAIIVGAVIGGWLWWRDQAGVSTDDAFLKADLVAVPAEVGGRLVAVLVVENQHVNAGDSLLRIDDTDYKLRLVQAQSALDGATADAKRALQSLAATRSDAQSGKVRLADAERERSLQADLASGGASMQVAVDRASTAKNLAAQGVATARAAIDAAEAGVEAAQARVAGATAALALAQRDLSFVEVKAPASGVVSKLDSQPGELVQRGQCVLALVPDERYVVANFKETDLSKIHVGDPVKVVVDARPDPALRGTVDSLSAGTGAVFSLLPADNATGNFIKVVQRLPVRVKLDQASPDLPAGLSATVTVERKKP